MWPKFKENKIIKILLVILVAGLIVSLIASLILWSRNLYKQNYYIGKSPDIQRTISISGEGKVTAIPDIAMVNLGLETEKIDVTEAQDINSQTMNSLIEKLKTLGIASEDIQTTNYSIYPRYDWKDGMQVLRGYIVNQNVTVKIRQTDKIDQVLRIAGELKLNQIGGLSFGIDQPEVYRQEARVKALENAKEKANELARVMGVKLGKVVSFSENENYFPKALPVYDSRAELGFGAGGTPTVEVGSQEIVVMATVLYELD
ncbi:MAG TPA: DUF541 domain-containing protein [Candidatus Uhrbacteria bacterium]|nr:DUF541 domain-containing protein [Candidatus Uhrbacteria bacterium]